MKRKLFLNTTTSLLSQIITLIVGFVLPRFILEQYGSEVNGLTQSIKQFLTIISFLDMGVGQVMRSALYKPLAENDNETLSKVIISGRKFYRKIAGVLGLYVLGLIFIYPVFIEQRFNWIYTGTMILILSIASFAQYYFGLVDSLLLLADQKGYVSFIAQITSTVFKLFICIVLIRKNVSIHILQLFVAVIFLIKPAVMGVYVKRNYKINNRITYSDEPIAQKWSGFAQHISAVVLESTDNIILTVFSTLSNVSIYSVYYMVIAGIMQVYVSLTSGIQSAVGVLWAKAEQNNIYKTFEIIEIFLHMLTVFVFGCTTILIIPFVKVYTYGLNDANYIQPVFAYILTLAFAVRCLRTPYNIWILAAGHYKETEKCHMIAAVLNLVISILALQKWGLAGIAIGTLTAFLYQTIWMAIYNAKKLIPRNYRFLVKVFSIDLFTMITIFLIAGQVKLLSIGYFGFFIMAMKVAGIALAITIVVSFVFYRKQFYRKQIKSLLKR